MEYKVVPFVPSVDPKRPVSETAAEQLQTLINKLGEQGWSYVRVESVTTWVAPSSGCFGFGATPGYSTPRQLIVFKKTVDA